MSGSRCLSLDRCRTARRVPCGTICRRSRSRRSKSSRSRALRNRADDRRSVGPAGSQTAMNWGSPQLWMRRVLAYCAVVVCSIATVASTAVQLPPARYPAVAFDFFVLFNPDSIVSAVEEVAPGKGREFTGMWRPRQFEYCWLRSITDRYVDFSHITEDART